MLTKKRALNRIITVYHRADSNLLHGCAGSQDMRVKYLCHLGRRTLTLLEFRYTTKLLLTFHLFIIQQTTLKPTLKHFITFVSVSVLGEGKKWEIATVVVSQNRYQVSKKKELTKNFENIMNSHFFDFRLNRNFSLRTLRDIFR